MNKLEKATNQYQALFEENPDYTDAAHRLAYLARSQGDFNKAYEWVDEATKTKLKAPVNQACLKAKLLYDDGKYLESANEFKTIISKFGQDSYSFMGLANIAFHNALVCGKALGQNMGKGQQDALMVKSYNKYLDVLTHEQANSYAALGVANVLAFFNKVDDAVEIYKIIQLASPNMPQALVNHAHLCIGI